MTWVIFYPEPSSENHWQKNPKHRTNTEIPISMRMKIFIPQEGGWPNLASEIAKHDLLARLVEQGMKISISTYHETSRLDFTGQDYVMVLLAGSELAGLASSSIPPRLSLVMSGNRPESLFSCLLKKMRIPFMYHYDEPNDPDLLKRIIQEIQGEASRPSKVVEEPHPVGAVWGPTHHTHSHNAAGLTNRTGGVTLYLNAFSNLSTLLSLQVNHSSLYCIHTDTDTDTGKHYKNNLNKYMMKRFTLIYMISKEIRNINRAIDQKIMKGVSYSKEAQRHKDLVQKLRRVESQAAIARTLAFLF